MTQKNTAKAGSVALYTRVCFLHKLRDGDWCLSLPLVMTLMPKK